MTFDEATFQDAHRRLRPHIRRRMASRVGPDDADDLASETFARAWTSRHTFRPERGTVDQWLWGIARHVLAGHIRARTAAAARRDPVLPRDVAWGHEESSVEHLEISASLTVTLAAMSRLTDADAEVVRCAVEAELTGSTATPFTNARYVRLHRARARLRTSVADDPDFVGLA